MGILKCNALVGLLDAGHKTHSVIANNLANLNTPGYRTGRVRFTQRLEELLDEDGNPRSGRRITTEVYRPMFRDVGADGNDVMLEREIVELNKNTLRMSLYLTVLHSRIRKLRGAIEGR